MKALFLTLTALPFIAPARAAEPVDEAVALVGMLPSQRSGQHVTPQERNPFAINAKEISKVIQGEEVETQESRIRAVFKKLSVSGVRRGADGRLMALVGDLILREGEEVKPVMLEQTETLVVSKVGPEQVELTFIESKDSTQPRTIPLPIKKQVLVSQKLFGQPKGGRELYVVNSKKATDPEVAAGVASVQQAPGGAAGSGSAWQSPPVSIVSAMAGLTGLFPRDSSDDERASDSASAPSPISPLAQPNAPSEPAPQSPIEAPNAVTAPEPAAKPSAGEGPAPALVGPVPPVPPVPESKPSAPVTASPQGTSAPAPGSLPATPSGTPAPALPPIPERVSPPTYLRRHGEQPGVEPEARPARPAVPPPAAGASPEVVE